MHFSSAQRDPLYSTNLLFEIYCFLAFSVMFSQLKRKLQAKLESLAPRITNQDLVTVSASLGVEF